MLAGLEARVELEAGPPHAAVLLAARYERVAWKYRSIAYSIILRNAGSAIATISLVAEALGLSSCGVGHSEGATFYELTGLTPHEECLVGEMLLGQPQA